MVNFKELATIAAELQAFDRSLHAFSGLYIWEFVSTFDYEWQFYRRRMPFKWTILLYIGARWLTLAFVVCVYILLDSLTEINCNAVFKSLIATSYSALVCTSVFVAIWRFTKLVIATVICIQLFNTSWAILGVTRAHAEWNPILQICVITDTVLQRDTMIVDLACQLSLLVIMFVGVLRIRSENGLWRVLYNQGILWLLLSVLAVVPSNTLLILNLNDVMNLIAQTPHLLIMAISTTRIHRKLNEYCAPKPNFTTVTTINFRPVAATVNSAHPPEATSVREKCKSDGPLDDPSVDSRPLYASLLVHRDSLDIESRGGAESWPKRNVSVQVGMGRESFDSDFVQWQYEG
ncbi:hypothetical protein HETIRDRAFT_107069 [Heterobasidion irregulare TC 32-1]|uniref:Uncharacterized protein n=1 Tax=Heterobasidion irregulare (strain TC 32-1) TaxID=747525 RepID=W4KC42_HETIT|nr:uncharacterized protein HETIRDRAFT_107069 [Heterobasidion irregulare TC 32-1]ETW82910.1 hypothetical protein HETIRDRAFT_107069 [Heterobasidion irregulare TC 32-1]